MHIYINDIHQPALKLAHTLGAPAAAAADTLNQQLKQQQHIYQRALKLLLWLLLALLVYEALSYYCMRPGATIVCGLALLVYAAYVTVYTALSY
jgi:polyferredoxin